MASWSDYISLFITVSVFVAAAYAVIFISRSWSSAVESTRQSLKRQGVDVSESGVSVRTQTRLADREEYCDATQRGIIKILGSSHYGRATGSSPSASPQTTQQVLHHSPERSYIALPTHDKPERRSPSPGHRASHSLGSTEEKKRWWRRSH
ncbi:hypothetical protein BXZ70DRAFT_1004900 [Cristinia sonorae]|uniref:Uncharacterized protein n=1 Tax=Cristinia sonorae TaxID=1940300 RepID=A0A8K0UXM4_9AGAR|nr:hypothetical protein BXZ70DRAFT_1004900 [Cristinia sonorae]